MLASLLASKEYDLALNMLEVGAVPDGRSEPFYDLLDVFPSARLAGVDLDPEKCGELARTARQGAYYYAYALGRTQETRRLHETSDPLCSSLYEPDTRFSDVFNNLDGHRVLRVREVRTVSLDAFAEREKLDPFDFIKMDIQGAELDVLRGAEAALHSVVAVVSEVCFAPMYKEQPLFGNVDSYLRDRGFMLHTFLGFGGRVTKPIVAHGTPNYPVQMLWSDALFTRDLFELDRLTPDQLLKLAVLLDVYDSKDVALRLVRFHDDRFGTALGDSYMALMTVTGEWTQATQQTKG